MFVNCGSPGIDFPGTKSPLKIVPPTAQIVEIEFLFLVNGRDDNGNGLIDEGFDGIDNNMDGTIDDLGEWENELLVVRRPMWGQSTRPTRSSGDPCPPLVPRRWRFPRAL